MCNPAKKLKPNKKLNWTAILADEYLIENFTLKAFMKAEVCDNKLLSSLISRLQDIYPMNNNYRYKRVKKLSDKFEVLLTEKENFNELPDEFNDKLKNVIQIELPTDKVLTKKQFDLVSKRFWPCSFHLNKYLESLIDKTFFESKLNYQLTDACDTYARLAVKLAVLNKSSSAAIVVDPRSNIIVASGVSSTDSHPLLHSVVNAVNNISARQFKEINKQKRAGLETGLENVKCYFKKLQSNDTLKFVLESHRQILNETFDVDSLIKNLDSNLDTEDYLCTNYK